MTLSFWMNANWQWRRHSWPGRITIIWWPVKVDGWVQSKSERDISRFSPPVCKFLSAIFPPARWRGEDQNLGLIYTSPGRCCQPPSDWSLQITWPGHWPLIGSQLTSDCCIIPGVPGPAPRQFSLTHRGNFTVNSQWCTESCKHYRCQYWYQHQHNASSYSHTVTWPGLSVLIFTRRR